MKSYSKLLGKIRNSKTRRVIGLGILRFGLRYGSINSIPTNLSSNSTQQVEQVQNYKDMQVINTDGKVIKTGSGILLRIRSGDLEKGSSPGARAKADARRNAQAGKFSSGSSITPGASGYTPQHIYRIYKESGRLPAPQPKFEAGVPNFNDGRPPLHRFHQTVRVG